MNVSATIIAFYLPVFIMIVLYFQVSKLNQVQRRHNSYIFWLSLSTPGLPWNNQKKKSFEFRWRRTSKDGENACRKDTKRWRSVSLICIYLNFGDGRWSKGKLAFELTDYFPTIVH